jgi:hypothetical protein
MAFRADVDRTAAHGGTARLTDAADSVLAEPEVHAATLRQVARALPALVAGTVC